VAVWLICLAGFACLTVLEWRWLARFTWYKKLRRDFSLPFFLLLTLFAAGGWRYANRTDIQWGTSDLPFYHQQGPLEIQGVICEYPQLNESSTRLVVCADALKPRSTQRFAVKGRVLVHLRASDWVYGQRVRLYGELLEPPADEEFSYKAYLAQRSIYTLMEFPAISLMDSGQGNWFFNLVYTLRRTAYQRINHFLPQPQAGLLNGILLGIETDISSGLEKAFQDTGTAHIVAISGFNMTLLASLFLKNFRRWLPLLWAGFLAVLTISFYTILVGAAPAVVRAALMSAISMTGGLIGRRQIGHFTLAITAAVMCAFNPLLLWNAGFQLSAAATFGLVIYGERMQNGFIRLASRRLAQAWVERLSGPVGEYFLFTLAAQVTTLPILLVHFKRLSLSTLISNPLILPPQPLVMQLGGLAVLFGLFFPWLGQIFAYLAWIPLAYTTSLVNKLAEIPRGVVMLGDLDWSFVLFYYAFLFFFTLPGKKQVGWSTLRKPMLSLFGLLTVAVVVWNAVLLRPDGKLHVWLPDADNAAVIFIRTPSGKHILINAGENTNQTSAFIGGQMPLLRRQLDLILVTQTTNADLQALPQIMERYYPAAFYWAAPRPDSQRVDAISVLLHQNKIASQYLISGERIDCGDGTVLEIISARDKEAVLLLTYKDFRLLLSAGKDKLSIPEQTIRGAVVVLSTADNVSDWLQTQPLLLINGERVSNISSAGWLSLPDVKDLQLNSDGFRLWVLQK
jgi:competence protein ComEC